jgi:hypothetical protein
MREEVQVSFRLPVELYSKFKAIAASESRSIPGQLRLVIAAEVMAKAVPTPFPEVLHQPTLTPPPLLENASKVNKSVRRSSPVKRGNRASLKTRVRK